MYFYRPYRPDPLPKWVLKDPPPLSEPIVPTPYDSFGRMFRPHEVPEGDSGKWYRLMILDRPAGPWRRSDRAAVNDAIDQREASESKRYGAVFLGALTWIAHIDVKRGHAHGGLGRA